MSSNGLSKLSPFRFVARQSAMTDLGSRGTLTLLSLELHFLGAPGHTSSSSLFVFGGVVNLGGVGQLQNWGSGLIARTDAVLD